MHSNLTTSECHLVHSPVLLPSLCSADLEVVDVGGKSERGSRSAEILKPNLESADAVFTALSQTAEL